MNTTNKTLKFKKENHDIFIGVEETSCVFHIPIICNSCDMPASYKVVHISEASTFNENHYGVLLECQNCGCHRAIDFALNIDNFGLDTYYFATPTETTPQFNLDVFIPNTIEENFPDFCQIYKDSLLADKLGLNTLYGLGLRKSVEILIKQWLSQMNPKSNLSKPLSQLIDELNDDDMKSLAKASAWLGNDFAHTERKFPDKTENDLLQFIEVLMAFIHNKITVLTAKSIINN